MKRLSVLLLAAAVVLRLPSIHQPLDRDMALSATIGRFFSLDTLPYRDLVDHKQPLVHFVYAAIELVGGARLTPIRLTSGLVAGLVGVALLRGLDRHLGRRRALAAGALSVVLGAGAITQGMDLNTEHLLVLPATAAVMFALAGAAIPAGLCVGLAVLAKAIGVFVVVPVVLALRERNLLRAGLAAAAPVVLVVAFYTLAGALDDLTFWNITYNTHYVEQGVGTAGRSLLPNPTLALLLLGSAGSAALHLVSHRGRSVIGWTALTWLLVAWAGAWLGGRGFPHYFAPCIPAAAMCLAVGLGPGRRAIPAGLVAAALVIVIGIDVGGRFGQSNNEIARDIYGIDAENWIDARPVAEAVKAVARPGDRMYVTSAEPEYYWFSGVEPASRYTFDYPVAVTPRRFRREIHEDLCEKPEPRFVVLPVATVGEFVTECLDLDDDYRRLARRGPVVALIRRDDPPELGRGDAAPALDGTALAQELRQHAQRLSPRAQVQPRPALAR